jgi:hypothetical protein
MLTNVGFAWMSCFGVVLQILWRGRFMCPLAVAGLRLRYFKINFLLMFGHPSRNPRRTALSNVKILGLPRDWWANQTAFIRVRTECVNNAYSGCMWTAGWRLVGDSIALRCLLMSSVHSLVDIF